MSPDRGLICTENILPNTKFIFPALALHIISQLHSQRRGTISRRAAVRHTVHSNALDGIVAVSQFFQLNVDIIKLCFNPAKVAQNHFRFFCLHFALLRSVPSKFCREDRPCTGHTRNLRTAAGHLGDTPAQFGIRHILPVFCPFEELFIVFSGFFHGAVDLGTIIAHRIQRFDEEPDHEITSGTPFGQRVFFTLFARVLSRREDKRLIQHRCCALSQLLAGFRLPICAHFNRVYLCPVVHFRAKPLLLVPVEI
ncbi:hypothetical protein 2204_scaffold14_00014 [Bacteriophage sp.]|nr:hypothetical protein 2204_scaffold14_00014 [Bacteriophage sp.]